MHVLSIYSDFSNGLPPSAQTYGLFNPVIQLRERGLEVIMRAFFYAAWPWSLSRISS